jgi:hypothetical protein
MFRIRRSFIPISKANSRSNQKLSSMALWGCTLPTQLTMTIRDKVQHRNDTTPLIHANTIDDIHSNSIMKRSLISIGLFFARAKHSHHYHHHRPTHGHPKRSSSTSIDDASAYHSGPKFMTVNDSASLLSDRSRVV